ncbi:MAG: hypothetical protein IT305_00830 [Chloroflexi bacterium]|nr:hypothetical protein [Chloroflexota bacterium]
MTFPVRGLDGAMQALLLAVEPALPNFLATRRWFAAKEHAIERAAIVDAAPLEQPAVSVLAVVEVASTEGGASRYFLPLTIVDATTIDDRAIVIARHGGLAVCDGLAVPAACRALLRGMLDGLSLASMRGGRFSFQPVHLRDVEGRAPGLSTMDPATVEVRPVGVEQSNSSVIFDRAAILKSFRRLQEGANPEVEIARFLAEDTTFANVPALVGWGEYDAPDSLPTPLGVLQAFVPNRGDGWTATLAALADLTIDAACTLDGITAPFLDRLADLGRVTAGLHLALASRVDVEAFAPQPITDADVTNWQAGILAHLDASLVRLERGLTNPLGGDETRTGGAWSAANQHLAKIVLAGADRLRGMVDDLSVLADGRIVKTRHHGDYHLGQVLDTGESWVILDFEGEPLRPLAERRARQSPLRDVAGMLRSFDYARHAALRASDGERAKVSARVHAPSTTGAPAASAANLAALLATWTRFARQAYLNAYLDAARAGGAAFLPASDADVRRALSVLELGKALYELEYEMGNRPAWVTIPLTALANSAAGRS